MGKAVTNIRAELLEHAEYVFKIPYLKIFKNSNLM